MIYSNQKLFNTIKRKSKLYGDRCGIQMEYIKNQQSIFEIKSEKAGPVRDLEIENTVTMQHNRKPTETNNKIDLKENKCESEITEKSSNSNRRTT